ncbi:MAG TPA: DUF1080 domain-containing protein [Rhizomicrobium sp.]|nr:DUF1080 domain-containing protein [Rhizomicrobium sp.]
MRQNPALANADITVVVTSCSRHDLLARTLESFAIGARVIARATTLLFLAAALPCQTSPAGAAPQWTALFNGKDLGNFDIAYASHPVDGRPAGAMFEVKNGVVHTYPGQEAGSTQPSAYFQTREAYSDFVLHVEYKWGDKKFAPRMMRLKDAGIIFHAYESTPNNWPHGIECQIEEKDVGDLWLITTQADVATKNVPPLPGPDPLQDHSPFYAPDGRVSAQGDHDKYVRIRHGANLEKPGWNSVDVAVRGDSAVYLVNGQVNMRISHMRKWDAASNSWQKLDRGKILFQAEYAEISYRNIKIRPVQESDPK